MEYSYVKFDTVVARPDNVLLYRVLVPVLLHVHPLTTVASL